jgi:hypothetical protein
MLNPFKMQKKKRMIIFISTYNIFEIITNEHCILKPYWATTVHDFECLRKNSSEMFCKECAAIRTLLHWKPNLQQMIPFGGNLKSKP